MGSIHTVRFSDCLGHAASVALGKPTGRIELVVNQGGIQNRIPKEIKEQLIASLDELMPGKRHKIRRIVCHMANGVLQSFTFISL